MNTDTILKDIERYRDSSGPIPLGLVKEWMQSDDIEVQGQTADLLSYAPQCERIEPAASNIELEELLFPYYKRCFMEDPSSDLADSRYGIARELVMWFSAVPTDDDIYEQTYLLRLKELLTSLYAECEEEVRDAIIYGFLEHVLEEPRWRPFFADWQAHPVLASAYQTAMEWATEHER